MWCSKRGVSNVTRFRTRAHPGTPWADAVRSFRRNCDLFAIALYITTHRSLPTTHLPYIRLQPALHTVEACITYSCSLHYLRVQPALPTVTACALPTVTACIFYGYTACFTYDYILPYIRLQPALHTVAACITYGCSIHYLRLHPALRTATPCLTLLLLRYSLPYLRLQAALPTVTLLRARGAAGAALPARAKRAVPRYPIHPHGSHPRAHPVPGRGSAGSGHSPGRFFII